LRFAVALVVSTSTKVRSPMGPPATVHFRMAAGSTNVAPVARRRILRTLQLRRAHRWRNHVVHAHRQATLARRIKKIPERQQPEPTHHPGVQLNTEHPAPPRPGEELKMLKSNSPQHRRTTPLVPALLLLAALLAACTTETAPRFIPAPHDIQASWSATPTFPGNSFSMALQESSGAVTGTGSFTGEAGPFGTLAISGSATPDSVHL
jgi:hypothetical protein